MSTPDANRAEMEGLRNWYTHEIAQTQSRLLSIDEYSDEADRLREHLAQMRRLATALENIIERMARRDAE